MGVGVRLDGWGATGIRLNFRLQTTVARAGGERLWGVGLEGAWCERC